MDGAVPIAVAVDIRPVFDPSMDPVARVDVEPFGHRSDGTAPPPVAKLTLKFNPSELDRHSHRRGQDPSAPRRSEILGHDARHRQPP